MTQSPSRRSRPRVTASVLLLLASLALHADETVCERIEALIPDSIESGDQVDGLQKMIGDLAREHMDEVIAFCGTFKAGGDDDDDRPINLQDAEFVRQYVVLSGVGRLVGDEQVPVPSSGRVTLRKVAADSPYPIVRACALLILEEDPEEADLRLFVARLGDSKLGGGHGSPAEVAAGALELLTEVDADIPYDAANRLTKVAQFWEAWWRENGGYLRREVEEEYGSRRVKVVLDLDAKSRQQKIDFESGRPALK